MIIFNKLVRKPVSFFFSCRKLPKALKEWPAFNALKKTVDDFTDMCPLIELMANKAMKRRHWDRLSEVTKYIFEVQLEAKFSLQHIMMAPLLQHREDIEVTVIENNNYGTVHVGRCVNVLQLEENTY